MRMITFEDAGALRMGPLTQTRPVFALRCGAASLIERQTRCMVADEVGLFVRPELEKLCRWAYPDRAVNDVDWARREPVVLVNGRWFAPEALNGLDDPHVGLVDGEFAYAVLPAENDLTPETLAWLLPQLRESLPNREVGGAMIDYPWDLIEQLPAALTLDEAHWRTHREAARFSGLTIQGPSERFLADPSARIEPFVLIDTHKGPVMIDRGVYVSSFSRLEGPCYIGPDTHILSGHVKGSALGSQCRIGGEVEASIVHGHSNKAHEGFLGHSYIGEWVNLGAGTQTSDLRNDYGQVNMLINNQKVETGLLKIGSYVGDHTKASIGTMFNTGSMAGPFGMLVTSGTLMPRRIPAFCLVSDGKMRERTDLREMFATAATMMARRNVTWTQDHADHALDLYDRTSGERQLLIRDTEQRRVRRVM